MSFMLLHNRLKNVEGLIKDVDVDDTNKLKKCISSCISSAEDIQKYTKGSLLLHHSDETILQDLNTIISSNHLRDRFNIEKEDILVYGKSNMDSIIKTLKKLESCF